MRFISRDVIMYILQINILDSLELCCNPDIMFAGVLVVRLNQLFGADLVKIA
jgi:hypothetical protein